MAATFLIISCRKSFRWRCVCHQKKTSEEALPAMKAFMLLNQQTIKRQAWVLSMKRAPWFLATVMMRVIVLNLVSVFRFSYLM